MVWRRYPRDRKSRDVTDYGRLEDCYLPSNYTSRYVKYDTPRSGIDFFSLGEKILQFGCGVGRMSEGGGMLPRADLSFKIEIVAQTFG